MFKLNYLYCEIKLFFNIINFNIKPQYIEIIVIKTYRNKILLKKIFNYISSYGLL